jgi:hypothetical protein
VEEEPRRPHLCWRSGCRGAAAGGALPRRGRAAVGTPGRKLPLPRTLTVDAVLGVAAAARPHGGSRCRTPSRGKPRPSPESAAGGCRAGAAAAAPLAGVAHAASCRRNPRHKREREAGKAAREEKNEMRGSESAGLLEETRWQGEGPTMGPSCSKTQRLHYWMNLQ